MSANFIQQKVVLPLTTLLKQGVDPSRLSLALTSGIIIGVFPILGIATIACTAVAAFYRLNLPAIQLANYLAFPMQIILFFPFLYVGETITGNSLEVISKEKLVETFNLGFLPAIHELTQYFILACLGWALALIPLFVVLYFVLKKVAVRLQSTFE
ncbi:MAG: DUF2062 domain-containing protein [Nitrospinae bacterium]|nr:DUF2062 domain-containing protein [Nitrospinota bacterium]